MAIVVYLLSCQLRVPDEDEADGVASLAQRLSQPTHADGKAACPGLRIRALEGEDHEGRGAADSAYPAWSGQTRLGVARKDWSRRRS